jgi:hypothetical protein
MPSRRKAASVPTGCSRRSGQRREPRSHLLIVECNSEKLAAGGLGLGSDFGQLAKALFPEKRIAVVQTASEQKLTEDMAGAFRDLGRVRSILIVGHSNESGLVLTADGLRSWKIVGNWLQKFEPEFCFLAACRAGKSESVRQLFDSIKTLRQIYASPAALYKNQTPPLAVLISMLLKYGRIDENQSGVVRIANYVLTGGQLFRWKRSETGPGEEVKAQSLDGLASALDLGPWNLLENLEKLLKDPTRERCANAAAEVGAQ